MADSKVKMSWNGNVALIAAEGGGQKGLERAAAIIKDNADKWVPSGETGELQRSGTVTITPGRAVISFSMFYGVFLHAHPEYHFQRGRRARFLEKANNDSKKPALAVQSQAMKDEIRWGSKRTHA